MPILAAVAGPGIAAAEVGKVFAATAAVVAIIVGCAWLLRHTGTLNHAAGQHLRITAARALGGKTRLVVVEFEGVQLLLGASPAAITVLHKAPVSGIRGPVPHGVEFDSAPGRSTFAARFAAALKHNAGLR